MFPNRIRTLEEFKSYLGSLSRDTPEKIVAFAHSIASNDHATKLFAEACVVLPDGNLNTDLSNYLEPINAKIAESDDALRKFLSDSYSEQDRFCDTFLTFNMQGRKANISLVFETPQGVQIVWESWQEALKNPSLVFAFSAMDADYIDYSSAANKAEPAFPPLGHFHPERFKATRPYIPQYLATRERYRSNLKDNPSTTVAQAMLQALVMDIVQVQNSLQVKYPRRYADRYDHPSFVMNTEIALSQSYDAFVHDGKQIFQFPQGLTSLFEKTDVDEIPLNEIKTPYHSQYLYFGRQERLEIEAGWFVDGAYVQSTNNPGDLIITLTAGTLDQSQYKKWPIKAEPYFTQSLIGIPTKTLAEAIHEKTEEEIRLLEEHRAASADNPKVNFRYEGSDEIHTATSVSVRNDKKRIEIEKRRFAVYKNTLHLVVNALCYITAYPDDIRAAWPEGTPNSLKQQFNNGTAKEKIKASSRLASLGYSPVHICGKHFNATTEKDHSSGDESEARATHLRRGHWRRQPIGPGRLERKMIWIKPHLVGFHNDGDDLLGHIYSVT